MYLHIILFFLWAIDIVSVSDLIVLLKMDLIKTKIKDGYVSIVKKVIL